jgi:phosphatidylglycerophosphatase A
MINAIIIMVLGVIITRIYKIYKNGGITDFSTEMYEIGINLFLSFTFFTFFMIILT